MLKKTIDDPRFKWNWDSLSENIPFDNVKETIDDPRFKWNFESVCRILVK
jgi:hypothetical protein